METAEAAQVEDDGWEESEHPRAGDGTFKDKVTPEEDKPNVIPGKADFDRSKGIVIRNIKSKVRKSRTKKRPAVKMYEDYIASGGTNFLKHAGLPDAKVSVDSFSHSISTKCVPGSIKDKLLRNAKALQRLYRAGTARREVIRRTKKGKIDKNKVNWSECWHVRGHDFVNGVSVSYDYTIAKLFSGTAIFYDLTIFEN